MTALRRRSAYSDAEEDIQRSTNEIDKDSVEINKLVAASKEGDWNIVWDILGPPQKPRKGYLINVIPESRRWGILHQAVYWSDTAILKKVMSYKSCDYDIPTKPCTFENGEIGVKNPKEIAEMYFSSDIVQILSRSSQELTNQGLDTFQVCNRPGETRAFKLLSTTLAAYKKAFHPGPIDPNTSLFEIMRNIYDDVNTSDDRWKAIKEKVCEATEGVCETTHRSISKSTTREGFYSAVIKTYTVEESGLYTYLNTAMRRQKESDYRPTARDLALGPHILMYEIILLFWGKLPKESGTTYRQMLLSDADLGKYKVGTKFVWVSFVSSTSELRNVYAFPTCEASGPGENIVIFYIDNSTSSIWRPRNIEAYAHLCENERTYPAGAHFKITRRKQESDGLRVYMTLQEG